MFSSNLIDLLTYLSDSTRYICNSSEPDDDELPDRASVEFTCECFEGQTYYYDCSKIKCHHSHGVHDPHFVTNISENVLSTHHSQIFYCKRQQSVFYYDDDRKQWEGAIIKISVFAIEIKFVDKSSAKG